MGENMRHFDLPDGLELSGRGKNTAQQIDNVHKSA